MAARSRQWEPFCDLDQKQCVMRVFNAPLGECRRMRFRSTHMTLKTLTIVTALLAGGTSLAVAQGPPTGGYPPVAGGAGGNPGAAPIPNVYGATTPTPSRHATRHHKRIYMSAKSHKDSKMNTTK